MSEPFNLPRGTVRAAITLLLILVSALVVFLPVNNDAAGEMFLLLTGIAVRDYFAHRQSQNDDDGPQLPKPYVGD